MEVEHPKDSVATPIKHSATQEANANILFYISRSLFHNITESLSGCRELISEKVTSQNAFRENKNQQSESVNSETPITQLMILEVCL